MLVTLCWALFLLPLSYAATTLILSASDPAVVLSPGWSPESSFHTTDTPFGSLTVTLPNATSSVSYFGHKRAEGSSIYGYTIDCIVDCIIQTVDGTDPSLTDDDSAPDVVIFTVPDLDPLSQHILRVYNLPSDSADQPSQITFDHLEIQNNAGSNAPVPGPPPPTGGVDSPISTGIDSAVASGPTSDVASTSAASASDSNPSPSNSIVTPSPSASSTDINVIIPQSSASTPLSSDSLSSGRVINTASPTLSVSGSTTDSGTPTPSSTSGSANAGSSSGATGKTSHQPSMKLIIGLTILAVAFTAAVIAALVVFIRQRQKTRQSPPLSPTASIIPIMEPPPMEETSGAPTIPFPEPLPPSLWFESPSNSTLMQKRMGEGAEPFPDNPPAFSTAARSSLWITRPVRSPAKSHFSPV